MEENTIVTQKLQICKFFFSILGSSFWLLPSMFLKRMVLGSMPYESNDKDIAWSVDFMVEKLEEMSHSELASRLTLNCAPTYVMPQHLRELSITVLDVWDP